MLWISLSSFSSRNSRLEQRFGINLTILYQPVAIISPAQTAPLACLKLITELENQCLKFRFNTQRCYRCRWIDRPFSFYLILLPSLSERALSKAYTRRLYNFFSSFQNVDVSCDRFVHVFILEFGKIISCLVYHDYFILSVHVYRLCFEFL